MPFKIVRNDLTKMQVDVIVNPANKAPIYSCFLSGGRKCKREKFDYRNQIYEC